MNGMGNCADDSVDCPLCMEPLEVDDLNFYPCTCGYQICRFCWHRIRTDENELCPACRKAYPENPADFTPLSQEQITALKTEKRQRDQQRKQKITENRKHLANVRVVQKNLVFVVGLPPRLAEPEILKKHEYFGKYGKIHKVVINPSTTYAGVQGPSASAYVTYCVSNDALRAIQSVNNIMIDGRLIKTSLGTTKYCSHFMKNQSCPKPDCMYLHDLGDSEASFTKEEMHQGKHQEYEKRLHDALIAATATAAATASANEAAAIEALARSEAADLAAAIAASTATASSNGGSKDAWPSLSVSPVNNKENKSNGKAAEKGSAKKTKDRSKNKKAQAAAAAAEKAAAAAAEKAAAAAQAVAAAVAAAASESSRKSVTPTTASSSEASGPSSVSASTTSSSSSPDISAETTSSTPDLGFDTESKVGHVDSSEASKTMMSVDEELNLISEIENDALAEELDEKLETPSPLGSSLSGGSRTVSESASGKSSPAAFRGNGTTVHPGAVDADLELVQQTNQTNLVKSNSHLLLSDAFSNGDQEQDQHTDQLTSLLRNTSATSNNGTVSTPSTFMPPPGLSLNSNANGRAGIGGLDVGGGDSGLNGHSLTNGLLNNVIDTSSRFSKLDLFDDNNSFFSTNTFHQPYFKQLDQPQQQFHSNGESISTNSPQLPDLLNGTETNKDRTSQQLQQDTIDKLNLLKGLGDFGNSMQQQGYNTSENWEALKYALSKSKQLQQTHPHLNGLDVDDLLGMHQQQQQQQQQQQKRSIVNSLGMPHFNGLQSDFNNDFFNPPNERFSQMMQQQHPQLPNHQPQPHPSQQSQHLQRQQQLQQPPTDSFSHVYAGNMSKFFDFHKNQQQQQQQTQQQQFLQNNGLGGQPSGHQDMASLLDNSRLNSQFLDHTNGGHSNYQPPPQLQHSRMQSHFAQQAAQQAAQQQQQQPNTSDDDLGFDPFFETQKGLAELLENEMIQQNQSKLLENCQRTRMPPPGFNHMNAFGFGVPRAQGSKILPFMNGNNGVLPPQPHPQLQQSASNGWGQQSMQQQQQNMGYDQAPSHLHQANKSGFGSMTDWTALDPAIVSFRQFPSFMNGQQQQQQPPHQQLQQQQQQQQHNAASLDMFMPHLNQHQQLPQGLFDNSNSHNKMKGGLDYASRSNSLQQQSGGAFGGPHGLNLPNSIINQQQQQNTSAQLNFSHSNWLNGVGDQSNMFMSGFGGANNGGNANYDKFTIPMPPGFQNSGNKQQKAECIN